MILDPHTGWLDGARIEPSPNFDQRPERVEPECIVLHCISLPPGDYGQNFITRLFLNTLPADAHPYFEGIANLKVSAHFLIDRLGNVTQFVSTHDRAWHAGESVCLQRPRVNDFSIGIELEGLDTDPDGFTDAQYMSLNPLIATLKTAHPKINDTHLFSHSDIAPTRKPDPGPYFDWQRVFAR